jgi:predicted nucleotidyltransferase
MTAKEVAMHIIEHCPTLQMFEAYMFGSTLYGVGHDIDLLIVGPSGPTLSILKQEIVIAGRELPFDVLYMQPEEAIETGFINRENCVFLSVIASEV